MPDFTDPLFTTTDTTSAAVKAENTNQTDQAGVGVHGKSRAAGVFGESVTWHGVAGFSTSTTGGAGVHGQGNAGVVGVGDTWIGVYGETNGTQNGPAGIWGEGKTGGSGVKGHTSCPGAFGVGGFHLTNQGPGIFGMGAPAGRFEGDVEVTGDIRLTNADCAEDFTISNVAQAAAGDVMVLGSAGALEPCDTAYDRRVVGVVSGAGGYKPAIILDHNEEAQASRKSIALMGKVFCRVDTGYGAIEVGDLLTTSPTPGHAMKAFDATQAFGAVLGKALEPATEGKTLIPILVTLQ